LHNLNFEHSNRKVIYRSFLLIHPAKRSFFLPTFYPYFFVNSPTYQGSVPKLQIRKVLRYNAQTSNAIFIQDQPRIFCIGDFTTFCNKFDAANIVDGDDRAFVYRFNVKP
jgi:hypothetical protein